MNFFHSLVLSKHFQGHDVPLTSSKHWKVQYNNVMTHRGVIKSYPSNHPHNPTSNRVYFKINPLWWVELPSMPTQTHSKASRPSVYVNNKQSRASDLEYDGSETFLVQPW